MTVKSAGKNPAIFRQVRELIPPHLARKGRITPLLRSRHCKPARPKLSNAKTRRADAGALNCNGLRKGLAEIQSAME